MYGQETELTTKGKPPKQDQTNSVLAPESEGHIIKSRSSQMALLKKNEKQALQTEFKD